MSLNNEEKSPISNANPSTTTSPTPVLVTVPSKPEIPVIQCPSCKKKFSTNGNLKNHILTIHEKKRPFKCTHPNCDKSYSNKSRLEVHERTHSGIRPYVCHICSKTFNEKGNLKTHICFHSNQRPYICSDCGKAYKTNGHLKDHIEISHLNIKKFICSVCGNFFGRSSTLKAHIRTHTGEKNYVCPIKECQKAFAEKGNMMIHYKRHQKRIDKIEMAKIEMSETMTRPNSNSALVNVVIQDETCQNEVIN